jgi:hypothetical protein
MAATHFFPLALSPKEEKNALHLIFQISKMRLP